MLIDAELKNDFIRAEIKEIIELMNSFIIEHNFYKDGPEEYLAQLKEKARQLLRVI